MHRFNLTFKGKIQPGYSPDKVKQRFAALLGIDNPAFLARCFSGEPLVLRSDLDRKTAADLFHQLSKLGVVAELVRDDTVAQPAPNADGSGARAGAVPERESDHIDQKWAVSSANLERDAAERARERVRAEREALEESRRQAEAARQRAAEDAARRTRAEAEARAEARRQEKAQAARRKARAKAEARRARAEARARAAVPPPPPNPYALSPFRATSALRERPRRARAQKRRYLLLTTCALLALVAALAARVLLPQAEPITGARAVAALHGGGLLLLTPDALLLHDRAGVGSESLPLSTLGLSTASAVLALPESTDYLLVGRLESADDGEPPGAESVWRCALAPPDCAPFGPRGAAPAAQVAHPFTGMVLQAFGEPGRLRKLGAGGEEVAVADRAFASPPSLLPRDGLLYSNSPDGPALSVLRYEDEALGQQLDEILLLAPPALALGRERVGDFGYLGEKWWAILYHPQTGDRGLYLFDDQWAFLRQLPLPAGFRPQQVLAWGQKLLVLDPEQPALQRFNGDGQAEAPLRSDLLEALISEGERARWLWGLLWQALVTALCLLAAGAAALSYLQHLRGIAFNPGQLRGAEPIEGGGDRIVWLDRSPARDPRLRRLTRLYLACACLALVAAIIARVDVHHMAALLVLLAGPAGALGLYLRSPAGHIGVLGDSLLLVDHRNTYHLGGGARILYHGWFLMIDDVLVHAGPAWAPAFPESQLEQWIVPMAQRGVRVDRRAVLARLVEGRHPLVLGAGMVLAAAVAAASIALLG
ncbi:hypothetical protein [Parahaliea mediterranea]|uniref:Uncharacterized protein n=1 Tax=Parahaliea mediterranea TaxID=651086 RepID=A0A939IM91_9GAMM|nr:hypothetical protein [Parahaliea mediterranea]MBN7796788.1 hypothetical protein [Parahaliea mediterranea]